MIKGTQRRIIMVKDTESPYFDSAYFVIKSDISFHRRESDILTEANRMVEGYHRSPPPSSIGCVTLSKKWITLLFIAVALLSGLGGFLLCLIF